MRNQRLDYADTPYSLDRRQFVRTGITAAVLLPGPPLLGGCEADGVQAAPKRVAPARMGRRTFEFTADNPGEWFFHCHNFYPMEAGMARAFRYR